MLLDTKAKSTTDIRSALGLPRDKIGVLYITDF